MLKTSKQKLGFSEYGAFLDGSKAQQLLTQRTSDEDSQTRELTGKRDSILQRIWLAQTVKEAQKLMSEIPAVIQKSKRISGGKQNGKRK